MRNNTLKTTDLHVHLLQSLYPEDIFEMAKECYKEINWNRFGFLDRFEKIYGVRLDPIEMFERAVKSSSISEIEQTMVYKYNEKGSFDKFNIKSLFPLCVTGYYFDKDDHISALKPIIDRHKKEGISYVEYRHGFVFTNKEEWKDWNRRFVKFLKESSTDSFQAKYIMRIGNEIYDVVKEFIRENPDLKDTIVGIDFAGREVPPKLHKEFLKKLHYDNKMNPKEAIDVVIHIGEDYFDKSIESAIRWCHEAAELGAKRLGHCIALGLGPEIAIKRRPNAHTEESVSERLDQIDYDLRFQNQLRDIGIGINEEKLIKERDKLLKRDLDEKVFLEYNEKRLEDLRKRQDFVLNQLKEYGTVIETCPSSNLRIGGIPDVKYHPFKKFYDSEVNLVICSDDPGVFGSSISDEVDLIANAFDVDLKQLGKRLGNPYNFRLGKLRDTEIEGDEKE